MAGNREIYQKSMNVGHNAAWEQNWAMAIKAYSQAIQEIPEDGEAHIHLGLALLKAGRLEDALKVYNRAHQLSPDDPAPLERGADVLERMGRLKEAAQRYMTVADVYLGQRDLDKAISNWERATQLTPGLIAIHARLAQAYERVGDNKRALREYLTLAFNFQRQGDTEKAIKSVERALKIDKRNPQALNTLRALRSGGAVSLPTDNAPAPKKPQTADDQMIMDLFKEEMVDARKKVGDADPLGPIGEAMTEALSLLAAYVMESGSMDMATASALQGMELQRQSQYAQAVTSYTSAVQGKMRHPALYLNLGGMLYMTEQYEEAINVLDNALSEPQLAAGALHALGLAHFKVNKQKQAGRFLIQSLQAVDATLAANKREEAELAATYNQLLTALDGRSDEMLAAINQRFSDLLSGTDWKKRVAETRKHLEEVFQDQGEQGVVDFLGTGGSERLATTLASIDNYIQRGLFILAMDECHNAMLASPYYLPLHVRMAEIMMREGRLRQAINKYNVIAKAYMSRDENARAASILAEVLEMAPLDVSVRMSLISLLESEERHDEMLDQYIELARTHNQLGSFELSRETFQQAERIAKRQNAPAIKLVEIKHNLADMDQIRLDMRRALRTYEEILELMPEDERAYRAMIDLHYSQGNQLEATKNLDKLLNLYAKHKQINKIAKLLEELVRSYPNDFGLRDRLAKLYQQLGRKIEAIAQLDALGELQLEAGQNSEARNTIKRIIALQPDNVDDYRRLLVKLGTTSNLEQQ